MKIIVDGRRAGNGDEACYDRNVAYFTKRSVKKFNILHEFYHHLVSVYHIEISESGEERYRFELLDRGVVKAACNLPLS